MTRRQPATLNGRASDGERQGRDDADGLLLAGGDSSQSEMSMDALEIEGEAASAYATPADKDTSAWLFRSQGESHEVDLAELPALVADDENFVWIDLTDYNAADLRELAGPLNLREAGIKAALDGWKRPRLAAFGDQFFVNVTIAHLEPQRRRVRATQFDLFVGRNFLLSAHKQPLPFGDQVLARAQQSPELVRLDSAFMLYMLLDELLAYYEELAAQVEEAIEQMEQRALADTSDDFLNDVLQLKRYVFALSRLVDQHRPIFAAFLRADFTFISDENVTQYYRDLEERLTRLLDLLLPAREAANTPFDIYVSRMSHRTNQIMKVLTIVSTLVLPSTVILGVFGTTFQDVPIYTRPAFFAMIGMIVVVTVVILALLRRRGWI